MILKPVQEPEAVNQRDDSDDSERDVNELPKEWNSADWPADQCQRDDGDAGRDSDDEVVPAATWPNQRPDEKHGDHEVPECEPIGPVGHPRIVGVGVFQPVSNGFYPLDETFRTDAVRSTRP